jgi:hypothetical protein
VTLEDATGPSSRLWHHGSVFPLWDLVIAPVLTAADARSVVEIGALRGDNTRQILDHLGAGSQLHVIDPAPGFDPTELERAFGDRYTFHRALSLDVLGGLPPMDAALIDGDHNWYTVIGELRLLRDGARRHGTPMPLLILHDVGWPYGRRDLYYAPDTVPAEHRQPHRRAGMRPGRSDLAREGGMSPGHWNATHEGGPANGVLTALEDALAEHDRPYRTVSVPIYFGLAIVADEDRLAAAPALGAALDRLESSEGRREQAELAEAIRVRGVANHHSVVARAEQRIAELQAELDAWRGGVRSVGDG